MTREVKVGVESDDAENPRLYLEGGQLLSRGTLLWC